MTQTRPCASAEANNLSVTQAVGAGGRTKRLKRGKGKGRAGTAEELSSMYALRNGLFGNHHTLLCPGVIFVADTSVLTHSGTWLLTHA